MVNYSIKLKPNSHTFHITLKFLATSKTHTLKLPTWIPGSYMIREFSKNIINLTAAQNGRTIPYLQLNKNTWQLNDLIINTIVEVCYPVYAYEFGIRTAFLDFNRGYFNNSSLCLYVAGMEQSKHTLELLDLPDSWEVATGLTNLGNNRYSAENYDELIDCPMELGNFTRLEFKVKNVPHYFVLSGTINSNFVSKRLIEDVAKICQTQIDLFGGVVPFTNYTFILYLGGEIYTGLEHRNSTLLMAPYYSLPVLDQEKISDDYFKLLGLISHEFFHTWNVKRIKPQVFNPYNLEQENYTKLLWWFEGITSYYDDLILYKAGIIDHKRYLNTVIDNINNVYKYDGVIKQSLANSSMTSWIKYYRQDENSPNAIVSYYVKGALVGMCLDLFIRIKTKSVKSLDDVLKGLFAKWQADQKGVEEDEIPQLILQFTGCDLSTVIDYFTETSLDLPLKQLLGRFGITIHVDTMARYTNNGKLIENVNELPAKKDLDLGCKLIKDGLGYKITNVYSGSTAEEIGLAANDYLIALDNVKLTNIEKQLSLYKQGDSLNLTLFRQEQLLNIKFALRQSNCTVYYLSISDSDALSAWLS